MDKNNETSSAHDIKVKGNTLIAPEKEIKVMLALCSHIRMGKNLLYSAYEQACAEYEMTISRMKEILEIFNSEIKEISSTNQDMRSYINSFHT